MSDPLSNFAAATQAGGAVLNQTAPAGSIVTLVPDLFPPIDFVVNPTDPERYACLVPLNVAGTGADVACQAPGYRPCQQRCVAADGNTFPDGLPSSGAWELRALPLVQYWPAPPTRDQLCSMRSGFQGLTITNDPQYGTFNAFGPEITSLCDEGIRNYCRQNLAAGFNAVEFSVSWQYDEPSFSFPVPGIDLSQNIPELARRIAIAISEGVLIDLRLAGDGEGAGPGYNDPAGWSYGREWLMNNFPRIWSELKAAAPQVGGDVTEYIRPCAGYDGCWYGWASPDAVKAWWALCRSVIGDAGVQAFEYGAGICHLGDGALTYSSPEGLMVDVFLHEYVGGPYPPGNDTIWQIGKRMLGFGYVRPADQPADDDPGLVPSWLCMTPRGMQQSVAYEYDTYAWVRADISAAQVQFDAGYLRACGWPTVY